MTKEKFSNKEVENSISKEEDQTHVSDSIPPTSPHSTSAWAVRDKHDTNSTSNHTMEPSYTSDLASIEGEDFYS